MTARRIMSFEVRPPEGKHSALSSDESALEALLWECGYEPQYEPRLVMFRLWDEVGQMLYTMGVQPDFYVPELDLYVELTRQRGRKRKHDQLEMMITSGHQMLLIEPDLWANIGGNAQYLLQLIQIATSQRVSAAA